MARKIPTITIGFSVNPELVVTCDPIQEGAEKVTGHSFQIGFSGSSANVATVLNNMGYNPTVLGLTGPGSHEFDSLFDIALKKTNLAFKRIPILEHSNVGFKLQTGITKTPIISFKSAIVTDRISQELSGITQSNGDWRIATGVTIEQIELIKTLLGDKQGYRSLSPHKTLCEYTDKTILSNLLQCSDLLILNKIEFEACNMTFKYIHSLGTQLIIVTDAENGGIYSMRGTPGKFKANLVTGEIQFIGAGDWFHGSFVTYCLDKEKNLLSLTKDDIDKALWFAATVASKKIQMGGGGSHGPTRADIK